MFILSILSISLCVVRILHISSARSFGGGERHFIDLTRSLVQRGHQVFAALVPSTPLLDELLHVPASNLLTLPLKNALDLASARRLAGFVRERQIEIVHAHVARDYPLAAYAARRAGARFVITRHVPFALSKLHRLTLANVACVIAVSESVAHQLSARGIVTAAKIRVIPNGVDLRRFVATAHHPQREKLNHDLPSSASLFAGTIGELSEVKGQDDFVRAAALVAKQEFADTGFIIAGADNAPGQQNRARIEQLIARENLQTRVYLLGYVPDVAPLLASLDVYVSAARAEAFGLALVEAMACGVPCIATATDGARSIIEDDVSGRLVPIGDAAALARAVMDLLRDAVARARLGAAGRKRVHESFSLERMADATEEVYREALTSK